MPARIRKNLPCGRPKMRYRPFTRSCPLWQPRPMPEKKTASQRRKRQGSFPPLPEHIQLTLSGGARLCARVRPSARARRTRLTLDQRGQLTLTVPEGTPLVLLEQSLPQFLPWLERAWKRHQSAAPQEQLPQDIDLPLTGMSFQVCHGGDLAAGRLAAAQHQEQSVPLLVRSGPNRLLLVQNPGLLRFFGPADDTVLCARALRQWCRNMAKALLPPYLEELARQGGFVLEKVSVRDQRSRWGSCARARRAKGDAGDVPGEGKNAGQNGVFLPQAERGRQRTAVMPVAGRTGRWMDTFFRLFSGTPPTGTKSASHDAAEPPASCAAGPAGRISLNWRALLLPIPLLEHLCWHELCHLRHMNHSQAYRAELARYSPDWPQCEKALDRAWRSLPWWALPGDDSAQDDG
ncbi:MAG: hypothetical protein DESF_01008 [Desulfovibrio sp.]